MLDNNFGNKLTPDIILKKQFKNVRKGYDSVEVDDFLDQVINDYETFYETIRELRDQNHELKRQLAAQADNVISSQNIMSESNAASQNRSDFASTNYDILQRLSTLESKVYNLENLVNNK